MHNQKLTSIGILHIILEHFSNKLTKIIYKIDQYGPYGGYGSYFEKFIEIKFQIFFLIFGIYFRKLGVFKLHQHS